jgi:cytochrome c oxidase assembly factor CtaG
MTRLTVFLLIWFAPALIVLAVGVWLILRGRVESRRRRGAVRPTERTGEPRKNDRKAA